MFATLGDIEFDLINCFSEIGETNTYNFVQHERIDNKPRLQFLGSGLQEENIKLNFHSGFCSPEEELKKLKDVAKNATTLKFIKGNGEYVGIFVITEITSAIQQTTKDGDLIAIQVDLKLQECADEIKETSKSTGGLKKR